MRIKNVVHTRHKPTISMTKPNSEHMGDKMSNMLDDPRMQSVNSPSHGQFKMKANAANPIATAKVKNPVNSMVKKAAPPGDNPFGGSAGGGARLRSNFSKKAF